MKEKARCGNFPQLAESVRLATPLARFGKVGRTASKQRVGSSSLPGRAISLLTRHWISALPRLCCPTDLGPTSLLLLAVKPALRVLPGAGQIGIEVAFDLVVQPDANDFPATAFDFIADLVIKAVEFGIVERFFGFLETVVGSLASTKESTVPDYPTPRRWG